ncbi:MAG: ABC transporter permease subunit [Cardiobacteriaceae bacterium]|nr:ABC transporter permease subunit [Cardiobacteriaceae bacterium]
MTMEHWYKVIFEQSALWQAGVWQSLWLVFASLLLGLFIAIPSGILLASRLSFWYKLPVLSFSYLFRGTPMLVQLYFIYYGIGLVIGRIDGVRDLSIWFILKQAWPWVLLTLTLNTAAYTSEIVKGAIETTPAGEIEAAKAFGMNRYQMMKRIILPSALRRALPAYGNEIIFMLHGSAIVGVATLMDITGAARKIYSLYYEPFAPFLFAGFLYLSLTACIVWLFRRLEKRLNQHL